MKTPVKFKKRLDMPSGAELSLIINKNLSAINCVRRMIKEEDIATKRSELSKLLIKMIARQVTLINQESHNGGPFKEIFDEDKY